MANVRRPVVRTPPIVPQKPQRPMIATPPAQPQRPVVATPPAQPQRPVVATPPAQPQRPMVATPPAQPQRPVVATPPPINKVSAGPAPKPQAGDYIRAGAVKTGQFLKDAFTSSETTPEPSQSTKEEDPMAMARPTVKTPPPRPKMAAPPGPPPTGGGFAAAAGISPPQVPNTPIGGTQKFSWKRAGIAALGVIATIFGVRAIIRRR